MITCPLTTPLTTKLHALVANRRRLLAFGSSFWSWSCVSAAAAAGGVSTANSSPVDPVRGIGDLTTFASHNLGRCASFLGFPLNAVIKGNQLKLASCRLWYHSAVHDIIHQCSLAVVPGENTHYTFSRRLGGNMRTGVRWERTVPCRHRSARPRPV